MQYQHTEEKICIQEPEKTYQFWVRIVLVLDLCATQMRKVNSVKLALLLDAGIHNYTKTFLIGPRIPQSLSVLKKI